MTKDANASAGGQGCAGCLLVVLGGLVALIASLSATDLSLLTGEHTQRSALDWVLVWLLGIGAAALVVVGARKIVGVLRTRSRARSLRIIPATDAQVEVDVRGAAVIPPEGLPLRSAPTLVRRPKGMAEGGLVVRVVSREGDWALVWAKGWGRDYWVDGRRLVEGRGGATRS